MLQIVGQTGAWGVGRESRSFDTSSTRPGVLMKGHLIGMLSTYFREPQPVMVLVHVQSCQ